MQSLTFLDVGDSVELRAGSCCPAPLCADAATPLLLRLQVADAALSRGSMRSAAWTELHDAFLCRLSSLPAPPALQRLSRQPVRMNYRAAGLLSAFSLPHLTLLDLKGNVRAFRAGPLFISASTAAALAPLVSLVLPKLGEPDYGGTRSLLYRRMQWPCAVRCGCCCLASFPCDSSLATARWPEQQWRCQAAAGRVTRRERLQRLAVQPDRRWEIPCCRFRSLFTDSAFISLCSLSSLSICP